ncbi:hypothetical protein PFNF54_00488, partial [Plasmodium falciparum NF54]
ILKKKLEGINKREKKNIEQNKQTGVQKVNTNKKNFLAENIKKAKLKKEKTKTNHSNVTLNDHISIKNMKKIVYKGYVDDSKKSYKFYTDDDLWPVEWHGMPLGSYINQIRMGDIDAKFHFIRRNILDYLMFDFKTPEFENKYINFTWRKLYLGIAWFIHTRGHPIVISPYDKIQFDVFPMDFCKPEEIQV